MAACESLCGTLFLDEIAEMPLELQAKRLKAIDDRKVRRLGGEKEIQVDVQIIAASHRDLEKMVICSSPNPSLRTPHGKLRHP